MKQYKLQLLAGLTAITVALAGCSGANKIAGADGNPNEPVVTVEGTVVTKAQFDKVYEQLGEKFNLAQMPTDAPQRKMLEDTVKQMALNKMILDILLKNDAKKLGITVTQNEVEEFKQKEIFSQPGAKEQLEKYLDEQMITQAEFDESLKENILMNKFIEKKAGDQLQVSDSEVTAYYQKNKQQFEVPKRINSSHILVKAIEPQMRKEIRENKGGLSEADVEKMLQEQKAQLKKEAEELYKRVTADPGKFKEIAEKESDDTASAKNGGALGDMVEATTDPDFWAALEKTTVGKMYPGIVETQFGYHILMVHGKQEPKQQTLAEAKPLIHQLLEQQKRQQVLMDWANQKKASAKIEIAPKYQPQISQEAAIPVEPAAEEAAPEKKAS